MRFWIGKTLQLAGLVIGGIGCILAFKPDTTERQFIVLGLGGAVVFFAGCLVLGAGRA